MEFPLHELSNFGFQPFANTQKNETRSQDPAPIRCGESQ